MAGLTTAQLESELADLITARTAILQGAQSYQINGKTITRATLSEINRRIVEVDRQLSMRDIGNGGVILADFQDPYGYKTSDDGGFRR